MWKYYVGNTKKYVESMKKYEEICGKYEEICGSANLKSEEPSEARYESSYIFFSLYKCPGTWKNSNSRILHIVSGSLCSLWDLEKFRVPPPCRLWNLEERCIVRSEVPVVIF